MKYRLIVPWLNHLLFVTKITGFGLILVLSACKKRGSNEKNAQVASSSSNEEERPDSKFSLSAYVAECTAALGPAPAFRCEDGVEIGTEGRALDPKLNIITCDKPGLNNPGHGCVPGTRIHRIESTFNENIVDWVLLCQKNQPLSKAYDKI